MASSPHAPQWPEAPVPGELVQIPLPLPDMLLSAVGYDGGARYVGLRWTGGSGGDVLWSDGTTSTTGWWPPWLLLVRQHMLGRALFDSYDFGDLEEDPGIPAAHWLLADCWEHTLHVGLARDVEQLLSTQPSTVAAAANALGPERFRELLQEHMMTPPTPAAVNAVMRQRAAHHSALQAWLDARLTEYQREPR